LVYFWLAHGQRGLEASGAASGARSGAVKRRCAITASCAAFDSKSRNFLFDVAALALGASHILNFADAENQGFKLISAIVAIEFIDGHEISPWYDSRFEGALRF
jgi:hypothetical protein